MTGVSHNTITRFEKGDEAKGSTVQKMRAAFETAGVIFVEENGEGPGVRLKKRAGVKSALQTSHDEAVRQEEANMASVDAQDLRPKKRRTKP